MIPAWTLQIQYQLADFILFISSLPVHGHYVGVRRKPCCLMELVYEVIVKRQALGGRKK